LAALVGARVLAVDTTRPDVTEPFDWNGRSYASHTWREVVELDGGKAIATFEDGSCAAVQNGNVVYLAMLTEDAFLDDFLGDLLATVEVEKFVLDDDLRVVQRGNLVFAFNYSAETRTLPIDEAAIVLGDREIAARNVTVWRR
jgi:beta-galactosidase